MTPPPRDKPQIIVQPQMHGGKKREHDKRHAEQQLNLESQNLEQILEFRKHRNSQHTVASGLDGGQLGWLGQCERGERGDGGEGGCS